MTYANFMLKIEAMYKRTLGMTEEEAASLFELIDQYSKRAYSRRRTMRDASSTAQRQPSARSARGYGSARSSTMRRLTSAIEHAARGDPSAGFAECSPPPSRDRATRCPSSSFTRG